MDENLLKRTGKKLAINAVFFLVFFLYFIVTLLLSSGFAVNSLTGIITVEEFKFVHNFIQMPIVMVIFLTGVVGVLTGIIISLLSKSKKGIWFSGAGTVLTVFALFLIAGFNGTSFYPSSSDLQSSLTINNSSSSLFTLKTMMYVSFIIPFVFGYIWFAWKAINNTGITEEEMNSDGHKY